jgi:hypothetical protein
VGGIISLWWAASFRYGGRHHLVMMGGLDRNQQLERCGAWLALGRRRKRREIEQGFQRERID